MLKGKQPGFAVSQKPLRFSVNVGTVFKSEGLVTLKRDQFGLPNSQGQTQTSGSSRGAIWTK